jgi:hypothetical protein
MNLKGDESCQPPGTEPPSPQRFIASCLCQKKKNSYYVIFLIIGLYCEQMELVIY